MDGRRRRNNESEAFWFGIFVCVVICGAFLAVRVLLPEELEQLGEAVFSICSEGFSAVGRSLSGEEGITDAFRQLWEEAQEVFGEW